MLGYLSYGDEHFEHVRKAAARVLRNHLGELVKMVEKIRSYDEVPKRFEPRLKLRVDSVNGKQYPDTRSILQFRLLALNPKPKVAKWLRDKAHTWRRSDLSVYDKQLIRKLL